MEIIPAVQERTEFQMSPSQRAQPRPRQKSKLKKQVKSERGNCSEAESRKLSKQVV